MSTSAAAPSLEPYLRARAINPSLIPSQPPRGMKAHFESERGEDFLDFLRKLSRLALTPIYVPLRLIHQTLTSPLTLSIVLRLFLLAVLTLGSAVFSILAVGAFWYSWGTGGAVEVEGWLIYGSKNHRTPHTLVSLPLDRFQEDLRYDVVLDMELVRPTRGSEEMGNFMLSLELRSARSPELAVFTAAQPSLPPPPLPMSLLNLPLPSMSYIPCLLPWPFRPLCPSRLLGYTPRTLRSSAKRAIFASGQTIRGRDVVPLSKDLMEGVIVRPLNGGDGIVGSAFVSIGREDSFQETAEACKRPHEVRTTGWVVIRFIPRPTGIRWMLSSHPLPPLLLLPPISLTLTLSSALLAFLIITYLIRPKPKRARVKSSSAVNASKPMSEEALLREKRDRVFEERDREERMEAERRRQEWDEVESEAVGLRRMPEGRKRSRIGESTIGGSETTAPSAVRSFGPISEISDDAVSETTVTETATESGVVGERSRRQSETSHGWENAE